MSATLLKHSHIFEGNKFGNTPWRRVGPFIANAVHAYVTDGEEFAFVQGYTLSLGQLIERQSSFDGRRHFVVETIGM